MVTVVMWTWRRGTAILMRKDAPYRYSAASFVSSIERKSAHSPAPVPGTAIFLTSDPESTPAALLHNLKHNHVLHENNVILTIRTVNKPRVPKARTVTRSSLFPSASPASNCFSASWNRRTFRRR
jgi:KUP system potassium uptake protein